MSASRVVVAALVALVALLTAASASGKTYEVNKRSDHAPNGCKKKDCTLREAVIAANARDGSDRILLPERKTYNLSIANTLPVGEDEAAEGDLDVTDTLRVNHSGKGRAKVDVNGIDRVFDLLDGGSTTFKRIVIRGGNDPDAGDGGGGGIQVEQADLVLRRSSVSGNHADGSFGGGIELNGDENASFTMVRSALSGNSSDNDSGAVEAGDGPVVIQRSKVIGNTAGGTAGALYLDTSEPVRIVQSTIAGNRADGTAGGIGAYAPTTTIEGSTIANNVSGSDGGAIEAEEVVRVTNSTISGNQAPDGVGGGIFMDSDGDQLTLNAVTVVRNAADGEGGGLWIGADEAASVRNSLLALNSAQFGPDCFNDSDPFNSLGNNLLGTDEDCIGFDATGDFVNSNPKLGKLKNNGGPTQTVALKKGSPAINKAGSSAPNKDQRGEKRGKKPDIGAYERVKKKKKKKGRR